MINRSELMLNNSVISKCHNGLRTEVRDLSPDSLKLWANPFATYKYEDIDPIPLTAEILEQCGFERTISNRDSGYQQYGLNISGLDLMFSIECNDRPEFYLCMVGVDINYLHQLQNLYFALTGKELEVNLTK